MAVFSTTTEEATIRWSDNGGTPLSNAYTTAISNNTAPFTLGGSSGQPSLGGKIAEVMVFKAVLTDAQRHQVEEYLYQRYALGSPLQAPSPVLTPGPGIYSSSQPITITPGQPGDTVYYTTDGTTPTTSSSQYTSGIFVGNSITIKAMEVASGYTNSQVVGGAYTIDTSTNFTRSGMVAWYRADSGIISTSGTVTQWNDQSGNGNNATGSAGSEPIFLSSAINGQPALQFYNSNPSSILTVPNSSSLTLNQMTIVAVADQDNLNSSTNGTLLDKGQTPDAYSLRFYNSGGTPACQARFSINNNSGAVSGTIPGLGTFSIIEGTYDLQNLKAYINGAAPSTVAYTSAITNNTSPLTLGGTNNSPTYSLSGKIAEVMVFNSALTDTQRHQVEIYLHQRYGVGNSPQAPSPTLAPGPGIYNSSQLVTMTPGQAGDTIYYTTDGTVPTTSSNIYSSAISINGTMTVNVMEVSGGYTNSQVVGGTYTIDSSTNFTRSGLVAWYRADTGIISASGTVTQWNDQSGNGNNAAGSGSTAPSLVSSAINGQPALQFSTTSSSSLSVPSSTAFNLSQVTIMAVAERDSGSSNSYETVLDKRSGSNNTAYALHIYNGGSSPYSPRMSINGAAWSLEPTLNAGSYGVIEGMYDQQNVKLYVNGTEATPSAYTSVISNNTAPLTIGGASANSSLGGELAELLLFNSALSDAQRQQVEAYLHQRYGIGAAPAVASAPTFSPGAGAYASPQTVTIVTTTPAATIYYTTDGSAPTTSSATIASGGAILVSSNETVNAFAVANGYVNSSVAGAIYGIGYTIGSSPQTPELAFTPYRYSRGGTTTTTDASFDTFVSALDQTLGTTLPATGNSGFTSGSLPWFLSIANPMAYHLSVAETEQVYTGSVTITQIPTYPTAEQFQNPVVAFGAAGGGTALYTTQAYSFAFGSGGQTAANEPDLRLRVFAKSSFTAGATNVAPVATFTFTLPRQNTSGWTTFAQQGFIMTLPPLTSGGVTYPLTTTVQYQGLQGEFGTSTNEGSSPLILTHTDNSVGVPAYYYAVDYEGVATTSVIGQTNGGSQSTLSQTPVWMAISSPDTTGTLTTSNSSGAYSLGYTLDFTQRPGQVSTFISQPQFQGQPIPETYANMSEQELLNVSTPITFQFANPTSTFTAINNSPELEEHPALDKLAADLGNNPMAIANYVLNNIHLTDALSYQGLPASLCHEDIRFIRIAIR